MSYSREKTYGIGEVAAMLNLSPRQLRSWEENQYIPQLERVICGDRGYRRWRHQDIELARLIKKYLDEGFKLSVAAIKAKSEIND
jgi:DNA-binding transcriptional MerR regulator